MVHKSVLALEIIDVFKKISIETFVDGTLGAGGHAKALMENCMSEQTKYFGFDQDRNILKHAEENLKKFGNQVVFINENFCKMKQELEKLEIRKVDGILFDLGVSSLQLDSIDRGFSFKGDALLDMRMDSRIDKTAYDVLNHYNEKDLLRVFKSYSDFKKPLRIVRKILDLRAKQAIKTTFELASLFENRILMRRKKIHPATTVFQAVRIEVNDELNSLKRGLEQGFDLLRKGGLFAVISFHSLEDRIVKTFFRTKAVSCHCPSEFPICVCKNKADAEILTKRPIRPQFNEIRNNKRSRSAKMRVLCKK